MQQAAYYVVIQDHVQTLVQTPVLRIQRFGLSLHEQKFTADADS